MPRLSETGLTKNDPGAGGNYKAWVNIKDILSIPITITHLGKKHVDAFYFPSGDLSSEHDEFVCGFTFDDDKDAEEIMFGDYEPNATYGFSTNHQRIKAVLSKLNPIDHLPLEGVCFLVEQRGDYQSYYLGDSDSGAPASEAPAPTQPEPTEASAAPSRGARTNPTRDALDRQSARSESQSTGGAASTAPRRREREPQVADF